MSDPGAEEGTKSTQDVQALREEVTDLRETLEAVTEELEPGGGRGTGFRAPTLEELRRFTADVTIPAAILVLKTNIRALQLLQRTLRVPDVERGHRGAGAVGSGLELAGEVGRRAASASSGSLQELDAALSDLQTAVDPEESDDGLRRLLEEASELQARVETRLEEALGPDGTRIRDGTYPADRVQSMGEPYPADVVDVDVEAELESLKEDVDAEDGTDGRKGVNGVRSPEDGAEHDGEDEDQDAGPGEE